MEGLASRHEACPIYLEYFISVSRRWNPTVTFVICNLIVIFPWSRTANKYLDYSRKTQKCIKNGVYSHYLPDKEPPLCHNDYLGNYSITSNDSRASVLFARGTANRKIDVILSIHIQARQWIIYFSTAFLLWTIPFPLLHDYTPSVNGFCTGWTLQDKVRQNKMDLSEKLFFRYSLWERLRR